jgi:hypothetical protein
MQAKITVQTNQTGFCTYRASRGTASGINIPDLLDNTNTDARTGSIINGGTHVFILGTRKANDALAAAVGYWVGVTCGTDSEVSAVFATRPIQWANMVPDIVPFNSSKFGNMDQPVMDWNGTGSNWGDPASHSYVDPNTGVEYWSVAKPGWIAPTLYPAPTAGAWAGTPIDLSGTGKWTSPANVSYHFNAPSSFATATGAAADRLFIPLLNFGCPAGGGFQAFGGGCSLDDISFDVWCRNATVGGVTGFNMQLTVDGGQTLVGNLITTGNCTSTTTTAVELGNYPGGDSSPVARPLFKRWGYIPKRNMIVPPAGTVSVSGHTVTLTTPNPVYYNFFNLDWTAGTPILINGTYAHLAAAPTTSTTLTTVENLGTLTNVAYAGANFGVVLTKTNSSSANVDVTIGLNYAFSLLPYQGANGDSEMLNLASVPVSKSADGATCGIYTVGCSMGTLTPAIPGYLGLIQAGNGYGSVFLWIPRNSDGTPRGETRLLGQFQKPAGSPRVNGNGDTISGTPTLLGNIFFDDTDGTSIYGGDQNGKRAWRLSYNEAYGGSCTGYQSFHPYPSAGDYANAYTSPVIADDCFTWTVLTPLAGGKDIRTQIMGADGHSGAYQTGLNYLGQTVGTAHTGYDLGWLVTTGFFAINGGFLIGGASTGVQNHLSALATFADDGTGKFVLKSVHDTWSEPGTRWAGNHTCPVTHMGTFQFCVLDPLTDTGNPWILFPNANRAVVSQVNRAGFGSAPAWDSNPTLTSNTDFYTCPSALPAPYTSLSGTINCLQVRVNGPFCQTSPNTTYVFPDGKTEAGEFPCVTPGFGVSNPAYSKLQDVQVGDWLLASDTGTAERFVILTAPVYNSANDITFWLLRTAGSVFAQPTYGGNNLDDTFGQGRMAGEPCCTHSANWYLWAVPFGNGNSSVLDVSNPLNTWLVDNPTRFSAHGVAGPGSLPGTYNYSQGNCGAGFNVFCGSSNLTAAASVNTRLNITATSSPSFAGIQQPTTGLQTYQNATYSQAVSPVPFFVDFKAINPSAPGGPEASNSFGSMGLSLVGGTGKTYTIGADCCTPSPDYKRWGLQGYAGRFWFKDTSGPATFGRVADMADWSVCWARNANECVFGSTPGKLYMTAPKADIQSTCYSANFGLAVPCLSSFGPIAGQVIQFRNDRLDTSGAGFRKFGFVHSHIGLGYPFSNCRVMPDAQFMF